MVLFGVSGCPARFCLEGTSFAGLSLHVWCFVHIRGACVASPLLHVSGTWATQVCPSPDTPIGRRSVVALSSFPSGGSLGST